MAFIQDPRLRQRWNQISHNAETVTENAAAGIWSFQHNYINPCLGGLGASIDSCAALCIGDREDRARRARERDRGARPTRPEYMFDFYDDWDDLADDEGGAAAGSSGGGLLGTWGGGRSEDWDRLLAGTGSVRGRHGALANGEVTDQPKRKRGMSYGTRGARRIGTPAEDPTIIPSTAPLGFLGRLPFKIGGTLRYKPSAANLKDHPGGSPHDVEPGEQQPLLGSSDDEYAHPRQSSPPYRPRSNTTGSGETSSSYRSRGDLFPSDGEGDEDAVPLDDEFDVALERVDDRSSNNTRSSKGKRPANRGMSRTVSRTTISSIHTRDSRRLSSSMILPPQEELAPTPSLEDLQREEARAEREEGREYERRRKAAAQLAQDRGLTAGGLVAEAIEETIDETIAEPKEEVVDVDEISRPSVPEYVTITEADAKQRTDERIEAPPLPSKIELLRGEALPPPGGVEFVPARLPHFR